MRYHLTPVRMVIFKNIRQNLLVRRSRKEVPCWEPAWEFPPMTKVMQRGLICKGKGLICKGAPWICLSIYPKNRICLFYYFTTFTNSSDINAGLSPITFL